MILGLSGGLLSGLIGGLIGGLRGCLKRVVPGMVCRQEAAKMLTFEDINLQASTLRQK